MCKDCFFVAFENEIHWTVVNGKIFTPGDKVAIGASGGKGLKNIKIMINSCLQSQFSFIITTNSYFLKITNKSGNLVVAVTNS